MTVWIWFKRFAAVTMMLAVVSSAWGIGPVTADETPPRVIGRFERPVAPGDLTENHFIEEGNGWVRLEAPHLSSKLFIDSAYLSERLGDWASDRPFTYADEMVEVEASEVRFAAFTLTNDRVFTRGSTESVFFSERPMWVSVDEIDGRIRLDMDDGDPTGQDVHISKKWLNDQGITDPRALHESGVNVTIEPATDGNTFIMEVQHFSWVEMYEGGAVTLWVDYFPHHVQTGENITVIWHTEGGLVRLHSEVHWGTSSTLLSNDLVSTPYAPPTPHGNDTVPVYSSSRMSVLPGSATQGTIYFAIHVTYSNGEILTNTYNVTITPKLVAPDPAVDPLPISGATLGGLETNLSWTGQPTTNPVEYRVYLSPHEFPKRYSDGSNETNLTLTGLVAGVTYNWRVQTLDDQGLDTWSEIWNFTTPELQNGRPYAAFTYSVDEPNRTVSFNGSHSSDRDGDPLGYAWDFGDGQFGQGLTVNHTYNENGSYTVQLNVTDLLGGGSHTTNHNCVNIFVACILMTQNDAGTFGDAPGNSNCSNSRTLRSGDGGTPGAYEATLSNEDPSQLDSFDCFRFRVDEDAPKVWIRTSGSQSVEYRFCQPIATNCAYSWSGTTHSVDAQGIHRDKDWYLRVSIPETDLNTYHYGFEVVTERDFDNRDGKEEYRGLNYNDKDEYWSSLGMAWNKADTDGDGMPDGYERYWRSALGLDPANAADGTQDWDEDGITNAKEYYFNECGAEPNWYNLMIEIDEHWGHHTTGGGNAHAHKTPDLDSLKNYYAGLFSDFGRSLGGKLTIADTSTGPCGGKDLVNNHPATYTRTMRTNDYQKQSLGGKVRDDHFGIWHWGIMAHNLEDGTFGWGSYDKKRFVLAIGSLDAAGWTASEKLKATCHELGHVMHITHPSNNEASNNPPGITCMYHGRMTTLHYGQHDAALRWCNKDVESGCFPHPKQSLVYVKVPPSYDERIGL